MEIKSRANTLKHTPSLLSYQKYQSNERLEEEKQKQKQNLTIRSTSSINMQHPRNHFLRHPNSQVFQHRFSPFSRTHLQDIILNKLIPHTRNNTFIAINEPQNFYILPYCGFNIGIAVWRGWCNRRGINRKRIFVFWGWRRSKETGTEVLETSRERRTKKGEEAGLESQSVGREDGGAKSIVLSDFNFKGS